MTVLDPIYIEKLVKNALIEDIGCGDITTLLTIPASSNAVGIISAKQNGVIAGMELAEATFKSIDEDLVFNSIVSDGACVKPGDQIAEIKGKIRSILCGERVALNFLQRMSGIATLTSMYVNEVKHTKAKIIDTRKTTPGLRWLEKYSVVQGGGYNHRYSLSDGILIKDNHITASGGVRLAVEAAKKRAPHTLNIEVEISDINQLEDAISAGADAVLLDNMSVDLIKKAVEINNGRVLLEASGGVNLSTVKSIAETGVDLISVGELTHSPRALDISLLISEG
ncbi:MAG: carboxylating nicotinate-nucleotide diphosphorylase [Armatimonadota bacterium]